MRKYWWLLVLPLALLLWWGLGRGESSVVIHFSAAHRANLASTVPTNGKVEPAEWSAARAENSGVVRTVEVQRGQNVHTGQTLVTLDTASARADLAAALAREQEAQTELEILGEGGKASVIADLDDRIRIAQNAVKIAQRIYDSDTRLQQQQAATKLQVQTDSDALQRARLNLIALQNQRKNIVTASDRSVAEAKLHDAKAAVALAQHRLDLGIVKAPMSGTIYEFNLKVGAYLEAGAQVALVGNLDQVKVIVYVDEPDLGRVDLNMPVVITSESRPGQKWTGHVDKLPTEVTSLNTRTVGEVSTVIDNPRHDLLPGVSVDASIISKVVNDALVVPKAALRRSGSADGVYRLEGKVIKWTVVRAGISDINNVQILSGLKDGELVADRIIDPSDAEIRDGMRVKAVFR
jgi:HlyD family secretion protein